MLPDEKKLRLINLYALAIISFISTSFCIWLVSDRIKHDAQDVIDYKEVVKYKDQIIETAREQKARSEEIEKASQLLKK